MCVLTILTERNGFAGFKKKMLTRLTLHCYPLGYYVRQDIEMGELRQFGTEPCNLLVSLDTTFKKVWLHHCESNNHDCPIFAFSSNCIQTLFFPTVCVNFFRPYGNTLPGAAVAQGVERVVC